MKQEKNHMKFDPSLGHFKIRINDGFCEWEFPLKADESDSIASIMKILYKYFDEPIHHGKFISSVIKDGDEK